MNNEGDGKNLTQKSEDEDENKNNAKVTNSKIEDSKISQFDENSKDSKLFPKITESISLQKPLMPIESPKFSPSRKSNFGKTLIKSDGNSQIDIVKEEKEDVKNNQNIVSKNENVNSPLNNSKINVENKNDDVNVSVKVDEKEIDGKGKPNQKKEVKPEDLENQRTEKLINSKNNNRKKVVLEFFFVALLFVVYFVVDFDLEIQHLAVVRKSFYHLKLISQRPVEIKYTVIFTLEQLATATIQMQNSQVFTQGTNIDVRNYYTNLIYSNERAVFESIIQSLPTEFSSYETFFQLYNYEDLCQNYYGQISSDVAGSKKYLSFLNNLILMRLHTCCKSTAAKRLKNFNCFTR